MNTAPKRIEIKELPEGWIEINLNAAVESMKNGLYKPPNEYAEHGVACLRMYNIDGGRIIWKNIKRMLLSSDEVNEYHLAPGDLLVNRVNSRELVGKTGVFPEGLEPCVYESKNIRIRLRSELVNSDFVNYQLFLFGQHYFNYNSQQVVGMASISQPQIGDFPLLLAPRTEQDRIVSKVQAAVAKVEKCASHIANVAKTLKRFRQAVLAAACSGRLTEDWRQTRSVDSLRTKQLLEILAEHRKHADLEWHEPCFDNRYREPLPDGWNYAALGVLGTWASGGTPSKSKPEYWLHGKYPWVSPKDMKSDFITNSQDHLTPLGVAELKIVPKDSILFVVRGMILAHTFPVGIAMRELTINQDIRAVTLHSGLVPKYLLWSLQREAMSILFAVRESTHGTRRLESETLKAWPMPIPPSEEQEEIVRRIEYLFNLSKTIERHVSSATSRSEKLTQSILAKAFRGELVPTEAEMARREGREFEPASVLLERIRAERTNQANTPTKQRERLRHAAKSRRSSTVGA